MFESIAAPTSSVVFQLAAQFAKDPRADKIDLGIGVYRNEQGETPLFSAINSAAQFIAKTQRSKTYLGLAGDPEFCQQLQDLVLGDGKDDNQSFDYQRVSSVQATGGTAALRISFELIKSFKPNASIWLPEISWANHIDIIQQLDIPHHRYPYLDRDSGEVDFNGLLASLNNAKEGDVVLLHGCCHNPSGADLTNQQWLSLAELLLEKRLLPIIDLAYLGFGDGLVEDAFSARTLSAVLPETLIAVSCSKNFGIYRERTGCILAVCKTASDAQAVKSNLAKFTRLNYSMAPDHGALLVKTILQDSQKRNCWMHELEQMRLRIKQLRVDLTERFAQLSGTDQFAYIAKQKGMFSMLPMSPDQIVQLKEQYAIYLLPNGRVNVAGLARERIDYFVTSVLQILDINIKNKG